MTIFLNIIEKDPLRYFNSLLLDEIHDLDNSEKPEAVAASLCAIAGNPSSPGRELIDHFEEVLQSHIERENRKNLVSCLLLTLWKLDNGWISNNRDLRPVVMEILDNALSRDYSTLKIDLNSQTHKRLQDVVAAVEEFNRNLDTAIGELTSIERIRSYRQEMLKAFRGNLAQHLLIPFMPNNFSNELNDAYGSAEKYMESRHTAEMVESYEEIILILDNLLEAFNKCDSYFARKVAASILTLKQYIQDDFETNEFAQPADLFLTRNTKKYPLDKAGNHIEIIVELENRGTGFAYDVRFELAAEDTINLTAMSSIPKIPPKTKQFIYIPATVNNSTTSVSLIVHLSWTNYGSEERLEWEQDLKIYAQRTDVDWESLEYTEPYLLEPVDSQEELYGRNGLLKQLIALTRGQKVGSAYITGQKRVGKTSLANALNEFLREEDFIVVYFEGDYIQSTAEATIQDLGYRVCAAVKKQEQRAKDLEIPTFEIDFSPARDFLDSVIEISDRRIIIILDEFDEIPQELYSNNGMADAFFMALRNTSSRANIGFVLVGGEKMGLILEEKAMQLNKWKPFRVDYFDFNADYRDVILMPVEDILEFDEESLRTIYDITAGNPYFTKLLCGNIFKNALERRDLYITRIEVERAIYRTVNEVRANTFQHFWDDGLNKRLESEDDKRIRRRRLLIALSDKANSSGVAFLRDILTHKLIVGYGQVLAESELDEFVKRNILISDSSGSYRFKVVLFHMWLQEHGTHEVLASFRQEDVAIRERQEDEKFRVKPAEIKNILDSWDTTYYKGKQLTANDVTAWLEQFSSLREQRAVFGILTSLRFYSNGFIRDKLKEGHILKVQRQTIRHVKSLERTRKDILVSSLSGEGKSGSEIARWYAQDHGINITDCVVARNLVYRRLKDTDQINSLVFADDFIGSGNQLSGALRGLNGEIADLVIKKQIKVSILIAVATQEGIDAVQETIEGLKLPIDLYVGEIISADDHWASTQSVAFASQEDREYARQVVKTYGELLSPSHPLGFDGQGLAVAFENSCPNNTLPIFWLEGHISSKDQPWKPLFRR